MPASQRDPFELCGTTIDGKYKVLSVVGEGGFGVVYRGLHEGFDAPIAIKCLKLPPHFSREQHEELVRSLREEGRLLLRLSQRSPGIVQALDIGSFTAPNGARVPYLILEWLEGRTLAEELRARRARGEHGMGLSEALSLLAPAAQALAVAHSENIAHRDIKPENLFRVESSGKATNPVTTKQITTKILDFGIAKVLADASSPGEAVTSAAPSIFTPSYGAPEQFDKKRGASGPWTDVFALALVYVELVTAARALKGDSPFELYQSATDPGVRPTLFFIEWQGAVADKSDQGSHALPALALARLYAEMGDTKRAGQAADGFMRRRGAWTEGGSGEWSMSFLPFQLRAGLISRDDFERGRSEWREKVRSRWRSAGRTLDAELDWVLWSSSYGVPAEAEEEARAALEAMPREASRVLEGGRWTEVDLSLGKTYVLTWQFEKALAPLRRAANFCGALVDPMLSAASQLYLGMALEGSGDAEGARAAYEKVLARWGKARPKSLTAERAKGRLRGLGKGKQ